MSEYKNLIESIVDILDVHFKYTTYKIIEQDSNTFIANINTVYEGKTEDVHFLDDLVHAICFVFDENPFTSLGAATGTDDIMYSLYTYPEWQMGHDVPLHTRVYSEIRFMAVNPEVFIRIHISIPQ